MRAFVVASLMMALGVSQARAEVNHFSVTLAKDRRLSALAQEYAKRIGIDADYIQYCETNLHRQIAAMPKDGVGPYGANIFRARPDDETMMLYREQERYEASYMRLCLADAKNSLSRAEQSR